MDSGVLAKDKVSAAELVHVGLALVMRVEFSPELVARGDLLSHADVSHVCVL